MKRVLVMVAILGSALNASAHLCFHAGTYKGKGFGYDQTGKVYPYEVTTVIADAANGSNEYQWGTGGAKFTLQVQGSKLLLDGADVGATIDCGAASAKLHMPIDQFVLDEEWSFLGNYLLRHGKKVMSTGTVDYQELLLRQ